MPDTIPTIAFPPKIVDGEFVLVDEGSEAEILGSVDAILLCPRGHRDLLPDYGLPSLEHTRLGVDRAALVAAAVVTNEPRAPQILTTEQIVDRATTISVTVPHA